GGAEGEPGPGVQGGGPAERRRAAPPSRGRIWHIGGVNENDNRIDALVGDWMTVKDAAAALNVSPNRIKQFIRDHRLVGVKRGGELRIPAAFISGGDVLKGLPGKIGRASCRERGWGEGGGGAVTRR